MPRAACPRRLPLTTRRFVALVVPFLALSLAGCQTWQPVQADPATLFTQDPPERVRVLRDDGVRLTLEGPELRAGAIVATEAPGAVLVEDVEVLEVERIHVWRTVGFVLPGAAFVALVAKLACRC